MGQLLTSQPANSSPILESIQQVALQAFAGQSADKLPKRFVIVSDMLQNTAGLSQYHDITPFPEFRDSPYYQRVQADLSDVEVTILLLNRPQNGAHRGAKLMKFWEQYFDDAKAQIVRVHRIEG